MKIVKQLGLVLGMFLFVSTVNAKSLELGNYEVFNFDEDNRVNNIFNVNDHLVAIGEQSLGTQYDGLFITYNNDLTNKNIITYDKGNNERISDSYQVSDGIIVAGYLDNLGQGLVVKFDNDGNILWEKNYLETYDSVIFTDVIMVNDIIYVTGSGRTATGTEGLLVRYDLNGNYLDTKVFTATSNYAAIDKIDVLGNGYGIYINDVDPNIGVGKLEYRIFDQNDQMVINREYDYNYVTISGIFGTMINNQYYIFIGYDNGLKVDVVEANGNYLETKSIESLYTTMYLLFNAKVIDNKIYLVGAIDNKASLIIVNNDLSIADYITWGDGSGVDFYNNLLLENNSIYTVGETRSGSYNTTKLNNSSEGIITKYNFRLRNVTYIDALDNNKVIKTEQYLPGENINIVIPQTYKEYSIFDTSTYQLINETTFNMPDNDVIVYLGKSGIDVDNNEEVPNTFDNVLMSIGLGVVGVIVLTLTILAIRKKNNK